MNMARFICRNFCVRGHFVSDPQALKKRLRVVGLLMLLLSPCLVIFMLVYLFLRHAEQFYKHPSMATSRRLSNLSRWTFREFNEVDHLFKHRINNSVVHASDYLKLFHSPILSTFAKLISFIFGGLTTILIIFAFAYEPLLEAQIYGQKLLWYAAVFGAIPAISRAAVTNELLDSDPEESMSMVVQHIHYMPKRWRGKESTVMVRNEFETLFQYTVMQLLEEMASIFLTPYLLMLIVPKRVDDILQFITDFTVNVEGVGHVCSFSVFDFQAHGNSNYGSPCNAPRFRRSSQGKMEKSFLSFQKTYISWEPNTLWKQFLRNIKTWKEKSLQGHVNRYTFHPPRIWTNGSMETPHNTTYGIDNHLGLLWPRDANRNKNPYLLDWYYTSRPHHMTLRDVLAEPFGNTQHHSRDYWMSSNFTQNEQPVYEEDSGEYCDDRAASHFAASTTAPIFLETPRADQNSNDVPESGRSHWWARSPQKGGQVQTSFFEPPDLNHQRYK